MTPKIRSFHLFNSESFGSHRGHFFQFTVMNDGVVVSEHCDQGYNWINRSMISFNYNGKSYTIPLNTTTLTPHARIFYKALREEYNFVEHKTKTPEGVQSNV
jgi:archaellum component FlaF (FlaF/FlaG flagellin family)